MELQNCLSSLEERSTFEPVGLKQLDLTYFYELDDSKASQSLFTQGCLTNLSVHWIYECAFLGGGDMGLE